MPKRRQPDSLKQLCILNIVYSFKRIWWRDYFENFGDTQCMYVLGPFDALPSGILEEIIRTLTEKGLFSGKYLQILFTDRLRHLYLKGNVLGNLMIKALAHKSQKLESLHMKYANKMPKNLLLSVIRNLTAVRELDLTDTKCDDEMLKLISLNCPQLVKLSVNNCPGVTDTGVQSLCLGQTQKLQFISLQDSGASEQSAVYLLRTFPGLKELEIDNSINGVLRVIEEDIMKGNADSKFGIRKLHWDTSFSLYSNISFIVDHCPNVTDITCHGVISADVLKSIACIKTMKKLNLSYSHGYIGHHDLKDFVDFLKEVGNQLTDLFLSDTRLMPVREIGCYCSKLRHLTMICDSSLTRAQAVQASDQLAHPSSFKTLETMVLFDNYVIASEDTFSYLLCQAENIRSLSLQKCHALTEEALNSAYAVHGFKHLQSFKMGHCHTFYDHDFLEKLLENENELTVMHLHSCFNITFVHSDELQLCLQEGENWDIDYDWE